MWFTVGVHVLIVVARVCVTIVMHVVGNVVVIVVVDDAYVGILIVVIVVYGLRQLPPTPTLP